MELNPQIAPKNSEIFAQTADYLLKNFKEAYRIDSETTVRTALIEAYNGTGFMNDFVIELPQKAPNLVFVFRIFRSWLQEYSNYLRPSPIPMKEDFVKFFSEEWSDLKDDQKRMNPFCSDSHLILLQINSRKVWVSLNFDYSGCQSSLENGTLDELRPIRDLFKDPRSKLFKNMEKSVEIFKAETVAAPSSGGFGSWLYSSTIGRFDYPIEGVFEKFLELEGDLKISDLASLCHRTLVSDKVDANGLRSDKSDFLVQRFEGLTGGAEEEFEGDTTVRNIYEAAILNKDVRDCSQGFGNSKCPIWSWTEPNLSFFKRTIKVTESIFVAISGNHMSLEGFGVSARDLEILKRDDVPHFVVRIHSKSRGYGPNAVYQEFNMLVFKDKPM